MRVCHDYDYHDVKCPATSGRDRHGTQETSAQAGNHAPQSTSAKTSAAEFP